MLDDLYVVAVLGIVGDIAVLVGGEVDIAVGAEVIARHPAAVEVARFILR